MFSDELESPLELLIFFQVRFKFSNGGEVLFDDVVVESVSRFSTSGVKLGGSMVTSRVP